MTPATTATAARSARAARSVRRSPDGGVGTLGTVGTVRLGIAGAGGIAQAHALAAAGLPEVAVTVVADPRADAAAALAAPFGAETTTDPRALADPERVDLVLVCAPPVAHVELACELLESGVAVLCEKPLAIDVAGARQVVRTAEHTGTLLTMASKFRFVQDVAEAKQLLDSGAIGSPLRLANSFRSQVDMSGRWNSDPAVSGGGVLIDNGTHSVDIVRYLLGPVREVFATEVSREPGLTVEDSVLLLLRAGDALATVELSWRLPPVGGSYLALAGTAGSLEIGWRHSVLRRVADPEPRAFGRGYDKVAALRANLADVVRALRGEQPLRVSGADALASVQVIEAAYTSLRERTWVPVEGD